MIEESLNGFTGFARRGQGDVLRNGEMRTSDDNSSTSTRNKLEFDIEQLKSIPEQNTRWAWVEVNTSALKRNFANIKRACKLKRTMAHMGADAFGCGSVQVAKSLLEAGVNYLSVDTLQEGIKLREALINAPIVLLSQPPREAIGKMLAYKIEPSIEDAQYSIDYAELADAHGVAAPFHLRVNTGLNLGGARFNEAAELLSQVNFHRALKLIGVYTEFAQPPDPNNIDFIAQVQRFQDFLTQTFERKINPGIIYALGEKACICCNDLKYDMVGLCSEMYGVGLSDGALSTIDISEVMSVHARISYIETAQVGSGVDKQVGRQVGGGFGGGVARQVGSGIGSVRHNSQYNSQCSSQFLSSLNTHRFSKSSATCVLPLGFADGLLGGAKDAHVLYKGMMLPIAGRISKDKCAFECPLDVAFQGAPIDLRVGDEVVLVGKMQENPDAISATQKLQQSRKSYKYLETYDARYSAQANMRRKYDQHQQKPQTISITFDDIARQTNTSPLEVMCGFGNSRLPRVYTQVI